MEYNNPQEFPKYMQTAGKISVIAAIVGLAVFIFAFIVDIGHQELQKVSAQTATTSLTVLNTPPIFLIEPYEVTPSSTTTPTNSGDAVTWSALGSDANGADYYLLVCSTNASPTANASAAPDCGGGVQWAVSTATVSDTLATVSTTTVESADDAATQFAEGNDWFAWVCDADITQPACTEIPSQGLYATSSSPFNMNQRPVLTSATPAGAVDPGAVLTFNSVSTDPDTVDAADDLYLIVCQNAGDYNTVTNTCDANFIASTTVTGVTTNVSASTTTAPVIQDGVYDAEVFLIDEHGHEALNNPEEADFTINNVAPTVLGGQISLNGGGDMQPADAAAETTGFTLDFTLNDANSCQNTTNVPGSELPGFEVAIYRSDIGTTSPNGCNPTDSTYNPNFCYESSQATTTWNLDCTASTTSCTGPTDDTLLYECTFPIWFLTDPTDFGPNAADNWLAAVAGGDDQFATSSLVATTNPVDVVQFTSIDLTTAVIPYGALAPGETNPTLATTTTVENTGNTGLDQDVSGSAMCPPFVSTSTDCSLNGTSTIFTSNQKFSSSSVAYGSAAAVELSTTTLATEVELNISSTTATSTFASGDTYWGIGVPAVITVAGTYTGLNSFLGVTAEDADW